MFKFIIKSTLITAVLFASFYLQAQRPINNQYSNGQINYVRTWSAVKPELNANSITSTSAPQEFLMTTKYLDGLGRPIQTVDKQFSPLGKDMVTAIEYDELGREQFSYLPFAANNAGNNASISDGFFKLNPFEQQALFYNNSTTDNPINGQGENWFYSQTVFEASPLNRPLKTLSAGNNWIGASRGVETNYNFNTSDDAVLIWTVPTSISSVPTTSSVYQAGQLYKNIVTDEHGNKIVEYKDKDGKVVLKKVQLDATPGMSHTGWLSTYYVYDDHDNLRYVLQPKAVELMLQAGNWNISTTMLNELCFYYFYDNRNRMVIKKVPGASEVFMVYDKRDRLVLSQDGNLRSQNKWNFTKFDQLNRPIVTGFYTNNNYVGQAAMQNYFDNLNLSLYENYSVSSYPLYTLSNSFPQVTNNDVVTYTYYDDYSWVVWYGFSTTKDNSFDSYFNNPTSFYPEPLNQNMATKGMVTGVWESTGPGLLTATYYDNKSRVLQTKHYNITTGIDITTIQYNFIGQVLQIVQRQQKSGTNSQVYLLQTKNEYDATKRLISVQKKIGNNDWKFLSGMEYDALGQLKKKKIGTNPVNTATPLEELNYDYNIRNWLLGVNRQDLNSNGSSTRRFAFDLGYDKNLNSSSRNYTAVNYNGNISGIIWKSAGDGIRRKYDYTYDAANRLMQGLFEQHDDGGNWGYANVNYELKMGDGSNHATAYDANGNIKRMQQWGLKGTINTQIDDLHYNYLNNSNKLRNVIDTYNDAQTKLGDFRASQNYLNAIGNKTINTQDYDYDVNGNLVFDKNKDIISISYNHLNLPHVITTAKGTITYTYDAGGNKLSKVVNENGVVVNYNGNNYTTNITSTTTYITGFVFESKIYSNSSLSPLASTDVLQFVSHEEGRIRWKPENSSFTYDYFIKDHLGNVRMVLTEEQKTDAYPAATMETSTSTTEEQVYTNLAATRVNKPSGYPYDSYLDPNEKVAKVRGDGNKIGPAIVLKVMAGDKFNIRVSSWWNSGNTPGTPADPISDLVSALISGIGGISSKATSQELSTNNTLNTPAQTFLNTQSSYTTSKPKAFLNWVFFDEQFKFVSASSGFEQVGSINTLTTHTQTNLPAHKNGYLYLYVSNETLNIDVFFDNLQVTHLRGPILEETHYYPFGLQRQGISSKAAGSLVNKKGFNGNEIQNKEFSDGSGLEFYDFNARTYDQQTGRFVQIDPTPEDGEQESLTPYHFSGNNPSTFNDPNGKCPWCIGAIVGSVVEIGTQVAVNLAQGKSLGESLTDLKGGQILIAAGAGAVSGGLSALAPKTAIAKGVVKRAELLVSAGESAAKQYNAEGKLDGVKVLTDVGAGVAGSALTKNVKVNTSSAIKTTEKQLDRAHRIAANDATSSGRGATVKKLESKVSSQKAANQGAQQAASGAVANATQVGVDAARSSKPAKAPSPAYSVNQPAVDNTAVKRPILY